MQTRLNYVHATGFSRAVPRVGDFNNFAYLTSAVGVRPGGHFVPKCRTTCLRRERSQNW